MVNAERFDFLPLGVNEAHGFLFEYKKKGDELMVEETIVLKYPFARLFYVKKGNSELKQDIKLGLEKAFKDGSFKKLVESNLFFKEGLSKSNLKNRIVIEIENPDHKVLSITYDTEQDLEQQPHEPIIPSVPLS